MRTDAESIAIPKNQPLSQGQSTRPLRTLCRSLISLFKIRVVMLLLLAAVGGAFLAARGWPGWKTVCLLTITGGLAASGASAINEYLERHADALMERTRGRRPLVNGALTSTAWIPWVGSLMILVPVAVILPFNPALALFVLAGAVIYIALYTVWLKPRTPLNIVIGGAAGSAAALSGSAAAGMWDDRGALLLAAMLFLWTPTHFWSLAIVHRDDYARARFPMLPVHTTPRRAALWILLHTAGTAIAAIGLVSYPDLGIIYGLPTSLATAFFLTQNIILILRPSGQQASRLFHTSNAYLALVLLMICVNTVVRT